MHHFIGIAIIYFTFSIAMSLLFWWMESFKPNKFEVSFLTGFGYTSAIGIFGGLYVYGFNLL